MDTAKARLSISTKKEYATLLSVFIKTTREDGLLALYRGVWPTLLGVVPYAGASFFTYETLKLKYMERTGRHSVSPWQMLFGAFAGLIGQTSSYPLDIVRRRMQTGHIKPDTGVVQALVSIYKTEGLKRGLYKGLSMNWLKGPVAVGFSRKLNCMLIPEGTDQRCELFAVELCPCTFEAKVKCDVVCELSASDELGFLAVSCRSLASVEAIMGLPRRKPMFVHTFDLHQIVKMSESFELVLQGLRTSAVSPLISAKRPTVYATYSRGGETLWWITASCESLVTID
ncbi:hypothetical protein KIN20_006379 [Parelaphostrongylus tenuis]|uniref:Mitochondrial carrier protein n=1 Tax=Parelaphostrongylus tenuis TaxID=148309 RepID=A0AAD5M1P4_PARTN|nr:hypothetical protein KIN20_006379 [Parelaphostrongylus tenuis]